MVQRLACDIQRNDPLSDIEEANHEHLVWYLRVAIFDRKTFDDGIMPRAVDDEHFAGEWCRGGVAGFLQAMFRAREVIAIENPCLKACHVMATKGTQVLLHHEGPLEGVRDQSAGDARFEAL